MVVNLEIVLLDADVDGIRQISDTLALYEDLESVHIISHGDGDSVQLGASNLGSDSIEGYAAEIAGWSDALGGEADLLFYGCNLASTEDGRTLLDSMAALCDCDVAASDDITGHQDLGGDWDFEYVVGDIETEVGFSEEVQQNWYFTLDITSNLLLHHTFDTDASDSSGNNYDGTLTNGATIDTSAGTNQIGDGKLSLDGSNDYVDASAHVANFDGLTTGTISAWVYADTVSSQGINS